MSDNANSPQETATTTVLCMAASGANDHTDTDRQPVVIIKLTSLLQHHRQTDRQTERERDRERDREQLSPSPTREDSAPISRDDRARRPADPPVTQRRALLELVYPHPRSLSAE